VLLRPPELLFDSISERSGLLLVISAKSETLMNRRDGVVGLNFRVPIVVPENQEL
jgi:hypothetical protein